MIADIPDSVVIEMRAKHEDCCICLDSLKHTKNKVCKHCKHTFHSKCLLLVFASGHTVCPLCRSPIKIREYYTERTMTLEFNAIHETERRIYQQQVESLLHDMSVVYITRHIGCVLTSVLVVYIVFITAMYSALVYRAVK